MMRSLNGLAFRFFKENKFIAFSSIIGVAISMSLILTMVLFTANAKQSLTDEIQKMFGEMDLAVGFDPEQGKVIDGVLLNELVSQEGIEQTSNVLLTRLYVDPLGDTVYTIGAESDELAKSRYHFTADIGDDELILNKRLAEVLDISMGDSLAIENRTYTVKEVTPDLEAAGPVTDTLILSKNRIQQIEAEKTGVVQEATYVLVKAEADADISALAGALKAVDPGLRIDIAQEDEFVRSNLNLLNQFIIVLSILVVLLTSLFIVSNFEVFLYKYKNQLAIMRAFGATTTQVFKVIFLQAGLINLIGGIAAFVFVLATYQLSQEWIGPLLSMEVSGGSFDVWLALGVVFMSFVVIQLFMLIPAYRSSKVLPLAIMQGNEKLGVGNQKVYKKIGIGMVAMSIPLIVLGSLFSHLILMNLIGALLLVAALFVLLPNIVTAVMKKSLPSIKSLFGSTSFVTVKNLLPQVRKNILVILIIGATIMVAVFGSAFIKTIQFSDEAYVKTSYPTDILLEASPSAEGLEVDPKAVAAAVDALPSIDSISTHSISAEGELTAGNRTNYAFYAFGDLEAMASQGLVPEMKSVSGTPVIISEQTADDYGLTVGEPLEITFITEEFASNFVVAGITEELPHWNDVLIGWESSSGNAPFQLAYVETADPESALQEFEELRSQFPALAVSSFEQSLEQSRQMSAQRWMIFIAVLAAVLFSVMLGVVNTLVNNIHSKRKEYAVLRAISLNRGGIRQVILTQVFLYLLAGMVFGLSAGTLLTYAVSLIDPGTPLRFDFAVIGAVIGSMFVISLLVFIPFANRIAGLSISAEMAQDNK